MSGLSGRCPTVTFSAGSRMISVDRSTSFNDAKCDDLKNGRGVDGEGDLQSNGTIKATKISVDK
ncbi:MAG TPA: DUF5666 domain-containing protein [Vicinamibacterales bacterium]|nr:DUF5666 domain-containing protein [Vicinamibacterales bacterium]